MAATVHPSDPTTADLRPAPVPIDAAAPTSPTARLITAAAVVGPVLLLASSVAWVADADELRGILQFWAMPFLALGLVGIASRLEGPAPMARAVVTALVAIGACAGASFAQEILMVDHFGVERLIDQETPSAALALKIPGPMFALAMMLIGLLSFVHRTQPRARAILLALAGISFPLARIPAVAGVAVVSDLALLAAMVPVFWSTRSSRAAA